MPNQTWKRDPVLNAGPLTERIKEITRQLDGAVWLSNLQRSASITELLRLAEERDRAALVTAWPKEMF